jgi:hypothetical protein
MDILKSDEIIGTIENYVRSEDERMVFLKYNRRNYSFFHV